MMEYSNEALSLVEGKIRSDLDNDRLLNLALVRLLEIIGEAANRLSSEEQALNPEIPWLQIIDLRNRLIHGYDTVDFDILWNIVTKDLTTISVSLTNILKSEG
jgi:uncharacterized protein with HEPN domain